MNKADESLREFVALSQNKYGLKAMTSIMHQLLHTAASVKDFGPLFSHSAFPFESENFQLLKSIKCAKGVVNQVVRNVNLKHVIQILKRYVYPNSPVHIQEFIDNMESPNVSKMYVQVSDNLYFNDRVNVNLGLSSSILIFKRMFFKKCAYLSCKIQNPRSCNSYIRLKNGQYIKILYFTHNSSSGESKCIVYELNTIEHDLCYSLFICTSISNKKVMFDINLIDNLCVFIEIDDLKLVRPCPNKLQY